MPYRRLPNTDAARLKAMKTAMLRANIDRKNSPLSAKIVYELPLLMAEFNQAVQEYNDSFDSQKNNKKEHKMLMQNCKLYVSHFMQVMNFAVLRGDFDKSIRKFYDLPVNSATLPTIQTEKQLEKWGKILVDGEQKRQLEGGKPMQNPNLSTLIGSYEKFIDSFYLQKSLQKRTANAQKKLVQIRPKIDDFIKLLWDEIEAFFEKYPPIIRREKAKSYGINYVYRKNEEKIELNDLLNFG
ncbi:MAG: hypothetical protein JXL97_04770 [Bacteroidales bacterium]|nr:hypothetical protein [Bacteroidales bacterium]